MEVHHGKTIEDPEAFPYSHEVKDKVTVQDVKNILRLHEKGIGEDDGWYHFRSLGTCRATTHEKGLAVLHRFNVEKMDEAQGAVQAQLDRLTPHKIVIMADAIDPKSDQTVKIALLSCDDLDATKINRDKTWAGVSRESIGNGKILSQETAKPVAFETADVDGDGKLDMVMSFAQKDLAKNMMAGAVYDTYLYTQEGRERVTAFDTVRIKGQTNKKYSSKERGHDR